MQETGPSQQELPTTRDWNTETMDWQNGCHSYPIHHLQNDSGRERQFGKRSRGSGIGFLKRRVTLTLTSPCPDIYSINAVNDLNSLYLSITILHNKKDEIIKAKTLLDCRARGIFLDQNFARKHNLRTMKLKQPIRARNVDGTNNKQGTICFYTDLDIKISDQTFQERFYITGLGNQKVILGLPWLRKHNPEINWEKGMVAWRNSVLDYVICHMTWDLSGSTLPKHPCMCVGHMPLRV